MAGTVVDAAGQFNRRTPCAVKRAGFVNEIMAGSSAVRQSKYDDYGRERPINLGCGLRAQRRWTLYCEFRSRVVCLSRTRIRNSSPPA
jgi:hypothetical protein